MFSNNKFLEKCWYGRHPWIRLARESEKMVENLVSGVLASRTASFLYKYPNIPETLGESTKINSNRRKFQNHQIQSRHRHGGVHHGHWCLSDGA